MGGGKRSKNGDSGAATAKRRKTKGDKDTSGYLHLRGAKNFRQRVACSLLTGRKIKIEDIRVMDTQPGLREYEASLLRLVQKITNGTSIVINETGTVFKMKPGLIVGGQFLEHDCNPERAIGYYLEVLLMLAPFGKEALGITLRGVTNHDLDIGVDCFRTVTFPLMKRFGIGTDEAEGELDLKIVKRGAFPLGGGQVEVSVPVVKELSPLKLLDQGKVKRIRGVAYTAKISPATAQRIVDRCRGVLNDFIPDVWIYTDHSNRHKSGPGPGFGLSLVAESTTDCLISAEKTGSKALSAEDLGEATAKLLLSEIQQSGCVDSAHQSLALLYMLLCPEDVSKIRVGKLTPYTIEFLRQLKAFFGVQFKVKADLTSGTVLLSCLGTGFKNTSRQVC